MLRFSTHPAYETLGDGFGDAGRFFVETIRRWLPAAAVLVLVQVADYLAIGSIDYNRLFRIDPYTDQPYLFAETPETIARIVGVSVFGWVVAAIVACAFYAVAIAGLRQRPLTAGWVIGRGLVVLAAALISGLAVGAAALATVVMLIASPPLGVAAFIGIVAVAIYVAVRLVFTPLAIFDGFGVFDAFGESWRISGGAMLRMLGWAFVFGACNLGLSMSGQSLVAALGPQLELVGVAVLGACTVAMTCFGIFLLTVLYESQRARSAFPPPGYGMPGWPPGWQPPAPPTLPPGWQAGSQPPAPPTLPPGWQPPAQQPPTRQPPGPPSGVKRFVWQPPTQEAPRPEPRRDLDEPPAGDQEL